MKFLRLFGGKPVVASPNVSCFLRLCYYTRLIFLGNLISPNSPNAVSLFGCWLTSSCNLIIGLAQWFNLLFSFPPPHPGGFSWVHRVLAPSLKMPKQIHWLIVCWNAQGTRGIIILTTLQEINTNFKFKWQFLWILISALIITRSFLRPNFYFVSTPNSWYTRDILWQEILPFGENICWAPWISNIRALGFLTTLTYYKHTHCPRKIHLSFLKLW